jgi:hypothetical protein
MRLPPDIHHYRDDVMMSLWLTHDGGQLVEIGPTFEHMHHCDVAHAGAVYKAHTAELSDTMSTPKGTGRNGGIRCIPQSWSG